MTLPAAMAPRYIRIVATPPGEAPLWVREKWLGLCLPLADNYGLPRESYVSGVLSGPGNRLLALVWRCFGKLGKRSGYAVYVRDAVDELAKTAPAAAAWWRENAPRSQAPGRKFLFRTPDCKLMELGSEAGDQAVLPVSEGHITPLIAASPAPSSATGRNPTRGALVSFTLRPVILLTLVGFGALWNWSHPSHPERQTLIHGKLVDWTVHVSNSRGATHRTVHLRITGYDQEFRIDPAIFHDLMGNRLPADFNKGATIGIIVDAAQLATPIHPLFKPGLAIVWVNGLTVNGVTTLALKDVLEHERAQWIGWLALAALAAVYLGYGIINKRKQLDAA